jgi:hypothetical protein
MCTYKKNKEINHLCPYVSFFRLSSGLHFTCKLKNTTWTNLTEYHGTGDNILPLETSEVTHHNVLHLLHLWMWVHTWHWFLPTGWLMAHFVKQKEQSVIQCFWNCHIKTQWKCLPQHIQYQFIHFQPTFVFREKYVYTYLWHQHVHVSVRAHLYPPNDFK